MSIGNYAATFSDTYGAGRKKEAEGESRSKQKLEMRPKYSPTGHKTGADKCR